MCPEEVIRQLMSLQQSSIEGKQEKAKDSSSPTPSDTSDSTTHSDAFREEKPPAKRIKLEPNEDEGEEEEPEGGDVTSPDLSMLADGNLSESSVFCVVPSRLSMLSSHVKYPMTIAEINRRLHGPEGMSLSVASGLLRRAKSKNGLVVLRNKLSSYGVTFPKTIRGRCKSNGFSSLTEGEAVHLAEDFDKITQERFPTGAVATELNRCFNEASKSLHTAEVLPDVRKTRKDCLVAAISVLQELAAQLGEDRPPFQGTFPEPTLPPNVQDELNTYAAATHNFGTPAILTGIKTTIRVLEQSLILMSAEDNPLLAIFAQGGGTMPQMLVQFMQLIQQQGEAPKETPKQ